MKDREKYSLNIGWIIFGILMLLLAVVLVVAHGKIGVLSGVPGNDVAELKQKDAGVTMTFVSGTEYRPNQAGQIIVSASYPNGSSAIVNSTVCIASAWYPDKTGFIVNQTMIFENDSNNEFINFTVPSTDGVYEYRSICNISGYNQTASHSFHVTRPRIMAVTPK